MKILLTLLVSLTVFLTCAAQAQPLPGAFQTDIYIPLLKGKKIAVFANQTSTINQTHLVDTLVKSGINVTVIFGPEHGFRGTVDAGEKVDNAVDTKTGIKVISLYGSHKKPTADDLKDVDIMLFDIQDVGVRFYTFISSLEYYIEAAAENNKPLVILDRPNPNGHYVDGPVLEPQFKSFVGMQPIPIVYGMTMGEYAYMLINESYKKNKDIKLSVNISSLSINCQSQIIESVPYSIPIKYFEKSANKNEYNLSVNIICNKNYTHQSKYNLPIPPSPNLKNMQGIYWYPSTCFFEGTVLSEGRGTDYPFQIFGHPSYSKDLYSFTPNPNAGAKSSKLFGQQCYGWFLDGSEEEVYNKVNGKINLQYLISAYKKFPNKDSFFLQPKDKTKPENYFFNKLAGNATLMQQIIKGKSERKIRKSWKKDLAKFNAIRKKYLLYK